MYYELSEMLAHKDSRVLAIFRSANSGIPVLCFLGQTFKRPNRTTIPMSELVESVRTFQHANHSHCRFPLGESEGDHKPPLEVVNNWCGESEGILRRWVSNESDEPVCEMTPVAETALKMFMGLSVDNTASLECNFDVAMYLLGKSVMHFNADPEFRRREIENDMKKLRAELELIENGDISRDTERGRADCRQAMILLDHELPSSFRKLEAEWRKDIEELMEDFAKQGDESFSGKVESANRVYGRIEQKRKFEQSREAKDFDKFYALISSEENVAQINRRLSYLLSQPEVRELNLPDNAAEVFYRLYKQADAARRYKSELRLHLGRFIETHSWDENKAIENLWQSVTQNLLKIKNSGIYPDDDETFLNVTVPNADIYLPGEIRERELTNRPRIKDIVRPAQPEPDLEETILNAFKYYVPDPVSDLRKAFEKLDRPIATFGELMEIVQPGSLTEINTYLDALRGFGSGNCQTVDEMEDFTFEYEGRRFGVQMHKLFVTLPVEDING